MIYLYLLYLLLNSFSSLYALESAVMSQPQGGRLGNSLLAYAHAKWFAYHYGLKFFYPPFPYSDQLMLHEIQQPYTQAIAEQYNHIIHIQRTPPFNAASLQRTDVLYEIPWFVPFECEGELFFAPFNVNWHDETFLQLLRNDFTPRNPAVLDAVQIPTDKISVGVHVRLGGGFDLPLVSKRITEDRTFLLRVMGADEYWPQKFPPHSYYIEQIREISKRFNHAPLYVHIFTDDQNPKAIVHKYRSALNLSNIEFGYRASENSHDANVLEDLYGMTKCTCLIMPASAFSYLAFRIGNHRLAIMPTHHRWEHGRLIIDGVHIFNK